MILAKPIPNDRLFYVYQRKYGLDGEPVFSRLQKLYHKYIWLPFARFSKRVVGVPTGDGVDRNGDVFWTESQGVCYERWQAEQAILRYQSGGYHPLPVLDMLPGQTIPISDHVVQTNGHKHNGKPTVAFPQVDVLQLAKKLAATEGLVEKFTKPVI
jgi:hypothetical protein